MPVINSQVLQGNDIRAPGWFETFGSSGLNSFSDLLAKALLQGMANGNGPFGQKTAVPTNPTTQNPGQLQFPSGASTPTSPLEMQQMQAMGGAPTNQGIVPFGQPSQGGVQFQPPTRMVNTQKLINDLKIAQAQNDIQKSQYSMNPNSPENQYQAVKAKQIQWAMDNKLVPMLDAYGNPTGGFQPMGGATPPGMGGQGNPFTQIEDDALAGDEDAVAAYRYLKKRGSL